MTGRVAVVLAAFLAAAGGGQAATKLTLDPAATRVVFSLGAALHTVRGTARMTQGEIVFDPTAGSAGGRVDVDARSLRSGNDSRDRTMHREVLESERYPDIVLVPERLEGTVPEDGEGEREVVLSGRLEIHGAAHPIRVPARVRVTGGRLTGTGSFTVPYVAWGMKDPSVFLLRVKKEVVVTLEMSGLLSPAP
jgi:polyisoprenoid-binding protein YceI